MSRNVTRADCRRVLLFAIPAAALTALAFAARGGAGDSDANTARSATTTTSPATPLAPATARAAGTTSLAAANQLSERNILPPVLQGCKDQRTVIPAYVGQVAKAWWNGPLSYQSTNDKAYTFNARSVPHPPLHNDTYTVDGVTYTVNHLRTRYTFTVSKVADAPPTINGGDATGDSYVFSFYQDGRGARYSPSCYTNHGHNYTVLVSKISGGTGTLLCVGDGEPSSSGTLVRKTNASGAASFGDATISFSAVVTSSSIYTTGKSGVLPPSSGTLARTKGSQDSAISYQSVTYDDMWRGLPRYGLGESCFNFPNGVSCFGQPNYPELNDDVARVFFHVNASEDGRTARGDSGLTIANWSGSPCNSGAGLLLAVMGADANDHAYSKDEVGCSFNQVPSNRVAGLIPGDAMLVFNTDQVDMRGLYVASPGLHNLGDPGNYSTQYNDFVTDTWGVPYAVPGCYEKADKTYTLAVGGITRLPTSGESIYAIGGHRYTVCSQSLSGSAKSGTIVVTGRAGPPSSGSMTNVWGEGDATITYSASAQLNFFRSSLAVQPRTGLVQIPQGVLQFGYDTDGIAGNGANQGTVKVDDNFAIHLRDGGNSQMDYYCYGGAASKVPEGGHRFFCGGAVGSGGMNLGFQIADDRVYSARPLGVMTGTSGSDQAQYGTTAPTATIQSGGSIGVKVLSVSRDTTLDINTAICIVTANSPTVTLPTAVGITGRIYWIKNRGAGTVTVAAASGQTIDGRSTVAEGLNGCYEVASDGENWAVLSHQ
jgi:hypothetical protein